MTTGMSNKSVNKSSFKPKKEDLKKIQTQNIDVRTYIRTDFSTVKKRISPQKALLPKPPPHTPHSSVRRNLRKAINELKQLSNNLHIPSSVEEKAVLIYQKVLDEGLGSGRKIKSIAAASLYAACRQNNMPRTLMDIAEFSKSSRKDVARCYRLIQQNLNLKTPVDDPINYVPKIASKTSLDQKTQNLAIELLKNGKKRNVIAGKAPRSIAAAALYIACIMNQISITQSGIAYAAGVSEVTIRNRFKKLVQDLDLRI